MSDYESILRALLRGMGYGAALGALYVSIMVFAADSGRELDYIQEGLNYTAFGALIGSLSMIIIHLVGESIYRELS